MAIALMPLVCKAQIIIESISEDVLDLTAATQKRLDLNRNPCALVKIEMISPEASFQGNVVGDVAYNVGEYLVYVSPGTKILKLLHPEQTPLIIDFAKYGIGQLHGERTYLVKISIPSNIKVVDLEELLTQAKTAYFDEKNYGKAFRLFKKASEYNSPEAMFMVSIMIDNGRGTTKDGAEAHRWCVKAAELGHPAAQYNLGVKYFEGENVSKDMSKGVEWFTRAALQGMAPAMYNLGSAYEFGYGVDVDYDEAEDQYYNALQNEYNCSEDLERVREKNTYPENNCVEFSLICEKAGRVFCLPITEWAKLSEKRKSHFEKVGVHMVDVNGKPFIVTERNTDNEISYSDAVVKYGKSLMSDAQANAIKKNSEQLNNSMSAFGLRPLRGNYWIATESGNPKGLVFASDAPFAVILNMADGSVMGVRPIINISEE